MTMNSIIGRIVEKAEKKDSFIAGALAVTLTVGFVYLTIESGKFMRDKAFAPLDTNTSFLEYMFKIGVSTVVLTESLCVIKDVVDIISHD